MKTRKKLKRAAVETSRWRPFYNKNYDMLGINNKYLTKITRGNIMDIKKGNMELVEKKRIK